MSGIDDDMTTLLAQVREGNQGAAERLLPMLYAELRRMAGAYLQRERPGHTLQATALVNEVYLRLAGGEPISWQNRAHFFAMAANSMRQILLDYARRRRADKRGGRDAQQVDLAPDIPGVSPKIENVIAIDEALERLAQIDARQSRLVELRFFAGLNVEEVAEVMGVSAVTIKREWRSAKAWLYRELKTVGAE
jgi:RNA polymerase sigma factor (TIGR02999 family)